MAELTAGKQFRPSNGTPFPKGISGNPNGRPVGSVSINAELRRQLQEGTTAEMLVKRLIEQAMQGNSQAMKIVWDRIEGPARFMAPVQPEPERKQDLSLLTLDELRQYRNIVLKLDQD